MDKVKYCLLLSLPSPNLQSTMRWEARPTFFSFARGFNLKTWLYCLSAFFHWLHRPYWGGSSQPRAEQGCLQWAASPKREFYSPEQVTDRLHINPLVGKWKMCVTTLVYVTVENLLHMSSVVNVKIHPVLVRMIFFFFLSKLRQERSSPSSICDAVFKAVTSLPGFSRPALICSVAYSILSVCLCCWGSRCWLSCCCATTLLWAIWPPRPSSPSASSAPGKNMHHTD